jgi:hypothetical protein
MKVFHAFQVCVFGADTGDADHFVAADEEWILKPVVIPVLKQGDVEAYMIGSQAPVALYMLK